MTIQQTIKAGQPLKGAGDKSAPDGRADHWTVLRGLLPFVWPEGRPDLRLRVVLAFAVLVLAKLVTVAVPIFFKQATDVLAESTPGMTLGQGAGLAAGALILAYGTGRVLMLVLNQVRDVFFTKVGQ